MKGLSKNNMPLNDVKKDIRIDEINTIGMPISAMFIGRLLADRSLELLNRLETPLKKQYIIKKKMSG